MTCWYEGPLAAFDTGATGADAETDRIVSAAVVVQDAEGLRPRITRWLVNPGVPVPAPAVEAHGLTEERLQRYGRWPAPVMYEVAEALAEQARAGRPLVVMDAPFGLTLLDRELRRHRASSLARWLERTPLHVLDRGCSTGTWTATARARGRSPICASTTAWPGRGAGRGGGRAGGAAGGPGGGPAFAGLAGSPPAELHTLQAVWHAGQARGQQTWFAPNGDEQPVDPAWPLRPDLPAAA
ncbi:3'-5' exonuclease OS=Streptomyces fumanus OX=67302 GN=GCM10018772_47540 PE=4 SV=1 [Streptomyces fumanus]